MEIEFKNVSLSLGDNKILEDINLKIESGTIHALIGPNGGGKTSLVKSILSLMPYKGSIFLKYEGEKIIGYVPQKLDFDRTLPITIEDFLVMVYNNKPVFLKKNKKVKEVVKNVLEKVGMYEKKNRLLGDLSGGELQRVLLAQAIYPMPNLLILDEPFTGLDTVAENFFLEILKELKKDGVTIIWVNHNLKQIIGVADKVSCLKCNLAFTGKPEEELNEKRILDIFS